MFVLMLVWSVLFHVVSRHKLHTYLWSVVRRIKNIVTANGALIERLEYILHAESFPMMLQMYNRVVFSLTGCLQSV